MSQADVKPRIPEAPLQDEQLTIKVPGEGGAIWAVRIPRFLYDRWSTVNNGGVLLGTLLIDSSASPPRITLKLPSNFNTEETKPDPLRLKSEIGIDGTSEAGPSNNQSRSNSPPAQYDSEGIPNEYDLNVPVDRAKNTWVFREKIRSTEGLRLDGTIVGKRRREKAEPDLLGSVQHDCVLHPTKNSQYTRILKQRRMEGEYGKKPIQWLEDVESDQGKINKMGSGWGNITSTIGSKIASKAQPIMTDRISTMETNEIRNRLFELFRDKRYWGFGAIRESIKQSDRVIRPVLVEIANQVTDGMYRNLWELKPDWRERTFSNNGVKGEGDEDEGMEGGGSDDGKIDEEDDFEEVTG